MVEPSHLFAKTQRLTALLGKQDQPTDALEDYCHLLSTALKNKGRSLELIRVGWAEQGWRKALNRLAATIADRQGEWVLVQYTHLAWSKRGFPIGFPRLIRRLIRSRMKVLIMFHDPTPFGGSRLRDRLRRQVQLAAIQRASRLADKIVSSVSPERVLWMQEPSLRDKIFTVPVGSNIPVRPRTESASLTGPRAVVVFGFTNFEAETQLVASVMARVAENCGPLRLVIFGRGAPNAEEMLRRRLAGSQVELRAFGILAPEEAGSLFANADVQLFVRLGVSARRGSAIAGISFGLPIVGFADAETDFPITEAGVRLVPLGDADGLVRELTSILQDDALRGMLRERSINAAGRYFSWERVAEQHLSIIDKPFKDLSSRLQT